MAAPRAVQASSGWWPFFGLLLIGVIVAASGAWFVFEWHSESRTVLSVERVQYDAAWAFAFAGIALLFNVIGLTGAGRWAAAVPILLGASRLAALAFPGLYGIRPMLANPWLPFGEGNYNEMGVFTAVLFVVLGCALAFGRPQRYRAWRSVAVAMLAVAAIALAILLLFGAWTNSSIAARSLQLAGGERSGAVLFLLLGAGILAHAVVGSQEEQRAVGKWLPAIVGFSALVCTLVLWHALREQDSRYIQNATGLVAASAKLRIEVAFEQRVRTLQRLAERSRIYGFTEAQFQQDAGGLLDAVAASPDLTAIAWTDPDLAVRWLTRRDRANADPGELRFEPLRLGSTGSANPPRAYILHYVDAPTGSTGVAIAAPAYDGSSLRGAILGALTPDWLHEVLRDRFADFDIKLLEGGAAVSSVAEAGAADKEWTAEQTVIAANARWSLLVTPTREYLRQNRSALPGAALALGIVLSLLLGLCTLLFQTAKRRARALSRTNARLLDDIQARRLAEQALHESERRTSLIVNGIKDCAIYLLDAKGRILTWNPGAEELTGHLREDIVGRPFAILYPAEAKTGDALDTAAHKGVFEEECWHLRKDGGRFCGDDIISGMRDEHGELQGYSVITRDATHRIELREQTERSRDFYMALFSGFPNMVWRSDDSGRCDYLNQAWLDFTGKPREAQLGDGWLAAVHPDDQPLWREAFAKALPTRGSFEVEFRMQRAGGGYGWIICNGQPYHNESGRFAGYLCACYDNTARRTVEDALKESEERLERITSNVPGMVFKLRRDKEGKLAFLYVNNPGCEQLTGLAGATVLANTAAFFELVPAADRTHLLATLDASATDLGYWNWSGRLHSAHEAGEKWVTLRARPRRAEEGVTIWDGVVVDDTQVRLSQLELERSREDLRALSRHLQSVREEEKARIAREVHDELGSTLTALKMDLAWLGLKLERSPADVREKQAAMSGLVDTAVQSTRKIVTDLRPSVLDDLGLAAALRWQATEFGRHAGTKVRVDAPDAGVEMNREVALTLFRIFQETLTNVARHAEATEVDVKLSANDGVYVLRIRDNGVGFDEGTLTKPTSNGIRGMRERARQFGGDVSVSSKPGGGTTLVITVPRNAA
jgi:PAS domain S-box-containing protein